MSLQLKGGGITEEGTPSPAKECLSALSKNRSSDLHTSSAWIMLWTLKAPPVQGLLILIQILPSVNKRKKKSSQTNGGGKKNCGIIFLSWSQKWCNVLAAVRNANLHLKTCLSSSSDSFANTKAQLRYSPVSHMLKMELLVSESSHSELRLPSVKHFTSCQHISSKMTSGHIIAGKVEVQ